jgi:hypothetical protein
VPEFRDSAVGQRALLLGVLAEPETQALLLASRRVGDSLRPLCWMLGIEVSVLYPARQAPARPVGDAAAAPDVDASPLADTRLPDPVTEEDTLSAITAPMTITAAGGESPPVRPRPREGGDFFTTA